MHGSPWLEGPARLSSIRCCGLQEAASVFSPKLLRRLFPLSRTSPVSCLAPTGLSNPVQVSLPLMPAPASLSSQTSAAPRVVPIHHLTMSKQRAGSSRVHSACPAALCALGAQRRRPCCVLWGHRGGARLAFAAPHPRNATLTLHVPELDAH